MIRFGIAGGPYSAGSAYLEFVQMAEALGFDSYWHGDHPAWFADCWSELAALAVSTKTIRLGPLVSCIYYRSPAMIARVAADVDRLSNGRLLLGLGIGDAPHEFAALGLPFPPTRARQQALEEVIQIIQGLWSGRSFSCHGQHFQVSDAAVQPGPVQQPHVPLLIGGGGERVTLRQVAQYADMSNFAPHEWAGSAFTFDDVRRKLDVLRRHCEAQNRPYDSILRSHLNFPVILAETPAALQNKLNVFGWGTAFESSTLAATPAEAIRYYQALADAGMQYFIAYISGNDVETMRLLATEVAPAVNAR